MIFFGSLVTTSFDHDQAGSLVQLKTLKLPEHASRGREKGGKLIYVSDAFSFLLEGNFLIPKIGRKSIF